MASKIYTAQEMREAADFFVRNAEMVRRKVLSNTIIANIHDLIPMLRYAAEIVERCEKMILPCDFDGAEKQFADFLESHGTRCNDYDEFHCRLVDDSRGGDAK